MNNKTINYDGLFTATYGTSINYAKYIACKFHTLEISDYNSKTYDGKHYNKFILYLNEIGLNIKIREFVQSIDDIIILPYVYTNNEKNIFVDIEFFYKNNIFSSFDVKVIYCTNEFNIEKFIADTKSWIRKPKKDKPKINFLLKNMQGFYLHEMELKEITIDFENDYEFQHPIEKDEIVDIMKSDKSGFILFSGIAGTGKTSLIKYLAGVCAETKFVFVPNYMAENLTDPAFLPFVIEKLTNSILIIEDSENILKDRRSAVNNTTSTILNVTDGILSDILNFKVIATQNTVDIIDEALLRKGRLIKKLEFLPLTPHKANNIAKRLNINKIFDADITLAEIYNCEEENNGKKETKSIGFSFSKNNDKTEDEDSEDIKKKFKKSISDIRKTILEKYNIDINSDDFLEKFIEENIEDIKKKINP